MSKPDRLDRGLGIASGKFDMLSHPDLAKIDGVRGSDDRYQEPLA